MAEKLGINIKAEDHSADEADSVRKKNGKGSKMKIMEKNTTGSVNLN